MRRRFLVVFLIWILIAQSLAGSLPVLALDLVNVASHEMQQESTEIVVQNSEVTEPAEGEENVPKEDITLGGEPIPEDDRIIEEKETVVTDTDSDDAVTLTIEKEAVEEIKKPLEEKVNAVIEQEVDEAMEDEKEEITEDDNLQALEERKYTIEGRLYDDSANRNGKFDTGEKGIANRTVSLLVFNEAEEILEEISTTKTDANGLYKFEVEQPTNYKVVFNLESTELLSEANVSSDEVFGTDFYELNEAAHADIEVADDTAIVYASAGVVKNFWVSGYIYLDENQNGQLDEGEKPVSNRSVILYKLVEGSYVKHLTATTDTNGFYRFIVEDEGDYFTSFELTDKEKVIDENPESTANQAKNDYLWQSSITLCTDKPGVKNVAGIDCNKDDVDVFVATSFNLKRGTTDANYSIYKSAAIFVVEKYLISGYLYVDKNKDSEQSDDEKGIEGREVAVYQMNDKEQLEMVAYTETDEEGFYAFNLKTPDVYIVLFELEKNEALSPYLESNSNRFGNDFEIDSGYAEALTVVSPFESEVMVNGAVIVTEEKVPVIDDAIVTTPPSKDKGNLLPQTDVASTEWLILLGGIFLLTGGYLVSKRRKQV